MLCARKDEKRCYRHIRNKPANLDRNRFYVRDFITSDGFTLNIRIFKMMKDVSLVGDGKTLFTFALGEAFEVENGTLKIFADSNLHERDGLVGMSGAYFHPSLVPASSCNEVFDAWEWIGKKLGISFYQMSQYLTGAFVLTALMGRGVYFTVIAPIKLAVNLYKLSKSIEIKPKIDEINHFMKGNVKSWNKDRTTKWYKNMGQMVRFLSNLNSEFEFALFSLECGFPIRLAKRPDMYLGETPVDVKSLAYDLAYPTPKYVRKIVDRANRAFQEQHAKLVGLDIGAVLIILGLAEKSASRIGRKEFCAELKNSLRLAKNGRKPILLFYHDFWTGDIHARTETLERLRRVFNNIQ